MVRYVKMDDMNCTPCDYHTDDKSNWQRHLKSKKHKKRQSGEPTRKLYTCDIPGCEYKTVDCSNMKKHKKTHPENNLLKLKLLLCAQRGRLKYIERQYSHPKYRDKKDEYNELKNKVLQKIKMYGDAISKIGNNEQVKDIIDDNEDDIEDTTEDDENKTETETYKNMTTGVYKNVTTGIYPTKYFITAKHIEDYRFTDETKRDYLLKYIQMIFNYLHLQSTELKKRKKTIDDYLIYNEDMSNDKLDVIILDSFELIKQTGLMGNELVCY